MYINFFNPTPYSLFHYNILLSLRMCETPLVGAVKIKLFKMVVIRT